MQPVKGLGPQALQYFSICPLSLTIASRVSNGSKIDFAAEVLGILHEGAAWNYVPLSVITRLGTPKQHTSPLKNLTAD